MFCQDEADVHLNPEIGTTYLKPGHQPMVPTPGKNVKRYLFGALNARTGRIIYGVAERKNAPVFAQFLEFLSTRYRRAKRIHLVLDNYIVHKAHVVTCTLEALGGRVVLHFLPPYSPDDNPDARGIANARIGNLPKPSSKGTIWTRDFKIEHQIDARGFRNPDPWPERADVVVIGDSLVFGYGVEWDDAWPSVELMPGRDVVNLGLIASGPQQHRRIYETFGAELQPRLLVLAIFAANDFWDA